MHGDKARRASRPSRAPQRRVMRPLAGLLDRGASPSPVGSDECAGPQRNRARWCASGCGRDLRVWFRTPMGGRAGRGRIVSPADGSAGRRRAALTATGRRAARCVAAHRDRERSRSRARRSRSRRARRRGPRCARAGGRSARAGSRRAPRSRAAARPLAPLANACARVLPERSSALDDARSAAVAGRAAPRARGRVPELPGSRERQPARIPPARARQSRALAQLAARSADSDGTPKRVARLEPGHRAVLSAVMSWRRRCPAPACETSHRTDGTAPCPRRGRTAACRRGRAARPAGVQRRRLGPVGLSSARIRRSCRRRSWRQVGGANGRRSLRQLELDAAGRAEALEHLLKQPVYRPAPGRPR